MIDIRAKCLEWGNQWGQTYTFDKMWIIDRSLLTLEKYDLGKAIKGSDLHN
jgi:hypothetical protein